MQVLLRNQYLLFYDIIIKSIQVVQERSKGDFRGEQLKRDILLALNVSFSRRILPSHRNASFQVNYVGTALQLTENSLSARLLIFIPKCLL